MYPAPWVLTLPNDDGSRVAVNLRTFNWSVMSQEVGYAWQLLADGMQLDDAIATTAEAYAVPITTADELRPMLELLRLDGMLSRRRRPQWKLTGRVAPGEPAASRATAPEPAGRLPMHYKLAAAAGFALALALLRLFKRLHLPFWLLLRIATAVRRIACRDSDPATAVQLVRTIERLAEHLPKAECMEVSLGAFFASAFCLRAPRWCVGPQFDPLRPHAWIEAQGTPIDCRSAPAILRV